MIESPAPGQLVSTSQRILSGLHLMFAKRLELLLLERREEQPRLLQSLLLGLAAGLCLLMAVLCLTAFIVVLGWDFSPLLVLGIVTVIYALGGLLSCRKLMALVKNWHALPATRDQFAKDREGISQVMK